MSSPYRIAPTPVTSRICAQCKLAITNDQGRSGSGWPPDMKYEHTIGGCAVAVERYVSELTRERDEALCRLDHAEADAEQAVSITISERDEARAEVERLQTASVASVDRWMEFVSHFQRLVRSNMGTEAGKLAIGYFKRAAEAGNLDEAGPPTVTPRDAAASERAAIVAMLERYITEARATEDCLDDEGKDCFAARAAGDRAAGVFEVKNAITRLDHHIDAAAKEAP